MANGITPGAVREFEFRCEKFSTDAERWHHRRTQKVAPTLRQLQNPSYKLLQ